jgi:phage I-like protein
MTIELSILSTEIDKKDITRIKILPDGEYSSKDGRPLTADNFILNENNALSIVKNINDAPEDIMIDYEHLSLSSDSNGVAGIAAGWFSKVEYVKGEGIYALGVKWTKKAKKHIKNLEFRYLSPVILSEKKTGIIRALKMLALVNRPALDNLEDLAALSELANNKFLTTKKGDKVDKQHIEFLKSIGLDETATLSDVSAKIKADQDAIVLDALKEHKKTLPLKPDDGNNKGNLSKELEAKVIAELSEKVNSLSKELEQSKLSSIISANKAKLSTENLVKWAETLTVDALNQFLENAVDVSALSQLQQTTTFTDKDKKEHTLSPEETEVISALGITKEQYFNSKGVA